MEQVHPLAFDQSGGLLLGQPFWEFKVNRFRQVLGGLLTHGVALFPLQTVVEGTPDFAAEGFFVGEAIPRIDIADFGGFDPLDLVDRHADGELLAANVLEFVVLRAHRIDGQFGADTHAVKHAGQTIDSQAKHVSTTVVLFGIRHDDVDVVVGKEGLFIAFLGGVTIAEQAVANFDIFNIQHGARLDALPLDFTVDVLVGDFHHRTIDLVALGFGEFEIRNHFDFEFEAEVLAILDFQVGHGAHGHGVANRSQAMTADGFLEAFLDQPVACFFAELTTEAFLQQLGWGVPPSEARDGGVGCQISQRIAEA